MKLNFQGRIANVNLAYNRALSPLFEAVVNSIHAIEDARQSAGEIRVRILRNATEPRQRHLTGERLTSRSIVSFVIEDNGVGFTSANYEAFETSDTDHKKARGAKGVGRFLWLKAFQRIRVTSTYQEKGKWWRRNFNFTLAANGTSDHELVEVDAGPSRSTVELLNFDPRYERECPRLAQTITERIIEHCLSYLLRSDGTSLVLQDDDENNPVDLIELYRREIEAKAKRLEVKCRDITFAVQHVRVFAGEFSQHTIHLCANDRDVQHLPLGNYITYIPNRFKDEDGKPFVYKAYVSGDFLDQHVNAERTAFDLVREGDLQSQSEPTEKEIIDSVVDAASIELGPLLNEVEEKIKNRIDDFVAKKYPEYRTILKTVDTHIREFKENSDEKEILAKLNDIQFREDIEAREQARMLIAERDPNVRASDKYLQLQKAYSERAHDIAQSRLAQCVIHRKIILDLLESQISVQGNGKFPKEEKVHELIFPMRKTSNEVAWEKQNLWIIDERLAYHRFLASDKAIGSFSNVKGDRDEPDLFVLNNPAVFIGSSGVPLNSAVIVEFKRAERTKLDENPIEQVLGYVRKLRGSKIKDDRGRTVQVHSDAVFSCYIIADLTPQLKSMAEMGSLDPTPDECGYVGFNRNFKAYVEIISYDKLLKDSSDRNRELFKALELE
jgi:hypothetical protein